MPLEPNKASLPIRDSYGPLGLLRPYWDDLAPLVQALLACMSGAVDNAVAAVTVVKTGVLRSRTASSTSGKAGPPTTAPEPSLNAGRAAVPALILWVAVQELNLSYHNMQM